MSWWTYQPRMTVAERKRATRGAIQELERAGTVVRPVQLTGRAIAEKFWGKSWCDNIERYQDFAYRLERGRSYVRSGSVIHLDIGDGVVDALVSGSEVYEVGIAIAPVDRQRWRKLSEIATGSVGSLLELLQGKLDASVMRLVCEPESGLFPWPIEIDYVCSCPDVAKLCKHVAAVFYAIGARLDEEPELLFRLRGVAASDLVTHAARGVAKGGRSARAIEDEDELAGLFGVEIDLGDEVAPARAKKAPRAKQPARQASAKKASAKKASAKKPPAKKASKAIPAAKKVTKARRT
jgi:uncharacterized Zn finger protein